MPISPDLPARRRARSHASHPPRPAGERIGDAWSPPLASAGRPLREISAAEKLIAIRRLSWPEIRRLMTVPGVNLICAASFIAAIGDPNRFFTSRNLVGDLGLDGTLSPPAGTGFRCDVCHDCAEGTRVLRRPEPAVGQPDHPVPSALLDALRELNRPRL